MTVSRSPAARAAVFLDRDGVINERPAPHSYVRSWDEYSWLPGAIEAIGRLSRAGYLGLVISNQRGIARRSVTREALRDIETRMQLRLRRAGGELADFLYCCHDLHEGCLCRKPAPGLILTAARRHEVDLSRSFMIGDSETDVQAGRAAGCLATIRVGVGEASGADIVVPSLAAAADIVVAGMGR